MNEKAAASDSVSATLNRVVGMKENATASGVFTITCYGPNGQLKWEDRLTNLVVNQGLQDMVAQYMAGAAYTATWYIGLYGSGATNDPAAGDTAASHAGWTEVTPYSNATRPVCTFGTATTANPSVITNSASPAIYTINDTATVGGAFLISDNTKGGTSGVLFSASDFASPGDRNVAAADTINVTYTFSQSAA